MSEGEESPRRLREEAEALQEQARARHDAAAELRQEAARLREEAAELLKAPAELQREVAELRKDMKAADAMLDPGAKAQAPGPGSPQDAPPAKPAKRRWGRRRPD